MLATHLAHIPLAATMQAAANARALRDAGHDVLSLTLGEPDFPTPRHAIEAAHQAALAGATKYPPLRGTPALIEAVRAKFRRDNNLAFAETEILIGHGARQILFDALTATLDPGHEIIVPAPYWNAYPLIARMARAVPVFIPCEAAANFLPDPARICAAITPATRWLVLNFPNNPSGAVCPAAHLAQIAEIMRPHPHVWILSDDMYEHLIHEGSPNPTLAQIAPDLRHRILTVSGVSKTYAMTGWRVGYAGGPAALIEAMARIQGQSTGGVSPIAQAAAAAALEGPQTLVATMRAAYAARARAVATSLAAIPGITCPVPAAAFYVFPNISAVRADDIGFAADLLARAHVACVHGTAFGAPGHLRLSTAASDATLHEACERIAAFCQAL